MKSELPDCAEIERDYGIKESTQAVWRSENRYGWRNLAIKVGRNVRYRRVDVEKWLASRTGLPTSRKSQEPKGGA
jgi:hypothetical protein